ncbi:MAG: hypothetical protein V4702_04600 [Patescibacteria group bacterium]
MANKTKISLVSWLQSGLIRLCRIHFVVIAIYAVYIIAADATALITPSLVLQRWTANALMLGGVGIIWYAAHNIKTQNSNYFRLLIYVLILMDIGMATFNVYTQRGMASRAVMLFAVPIVVATILLSRTALFLTATLCTAAYSLAAIKYFVDFFNEGYKAELYIEVGFYCAMFFIIAAILSIVIRFKDGDLGINS